MILSSSEAPCRVVIPVEKWYYASITGGLRSGLAVLVAPESRNVEP
jgi:hypothetical protein